MPELPFSPIDPSAHRFKCLTDERVRGCGSWYDSPFEVDGTVIVVALLCPSCFKERLAKGDPRITAIFNDAKETS